MEDAQIYKAAYGFGGFFVVVVAGGGGFFQSYQEQSMGLYKTFEK